MRLDTSHRTKGISNTVRDETADRAGSSLDSPPIHGSSDKAAVENIPVNNLCKNFRDAANVPSNTLHNNHDDEDADGLSMGSSPGMTQMERLKCRKQKRYKQRVVEDHEVYKIHDLCAHIQYDDESPEPSPLLSLLHTRRDIVQLALLASLNAELEDVRTATEKEADFLYFGPHDPDSGPADMNKEAEKDAHSVAGLLDPSGMEVINAPNLSWYTTDYINSHPDHLFMYADCAPPGKSNDAINKDNTTFVSGTPLARRLRPLANTLPYPVCEADGSSFNDSNVQRHRLRFQKITRRALARGQGNIIKTIVLPPEDRFDLYIFYIPIHYLVSAASR